MRTAYQVLKKISLFLQFFFYIKIQGAKINISQFTIKIQKIRFLIFFDDPDVVIRTEQVITL